MLTSALGLRPVSLVGTWLVGAVAAVGAFGLSAGAASATTQTFSTPGTSTFDVPSNVTQITVTAVGAGGGNCGVSSPVPGGRGASVTATVPVSPGETLSVGVGGVGGTGCTDPAGANGGGGVGGGGAGGPGAGGSFGGAGGGGASGVGPSGLAAGSSPLVVAGGGGGAAAFFSGGDAGSDGSALGATQTGGAGGAGTQTGGGAGGAAGTGTADGSPGTAGSPGAGGPGGAGAATLSAGGGGGGSGYYGGGGGGGGSQDFEAGGGGGGSSFTASDATGVTGPTPTSDSAMVEITYTAQPAPAVSTGAASAISTTGATVHGTVNPEGLATTYEFQYGTTTGYGSSTPSASAGSGSSDVAVSASISGLKPNTTYHYRIVATNASGTTDGADATFTTKAPPPSIHVRPRTVFAGKRVRVFGSAGACPVNDTVTLISRAFGHRHEFAGEPAIFAKVGPAGRYSVTTEIPAMRAASVYTITGRCGGGNLGVLARLHVRRRPPPPRVTG